MKKKVLAIALAVAVVAIMVGGTLAYFTAEDAVTNTFTIGSVLIEIYENGTPTDEDVRELGALIPIVKVSDPSEDESYIDKVIKVENTGLNSAYIRTHIAIPTKLVNYLTLDVEAQKWIPVFETTFTDEGGLEYTVYAYDYKEAVAPDAFTEELLKGVYLNSVVDLRDNPDTTAEDLEFCICNADGSYTFSGFVAHTKTDNGYATKKVNVLVASQAIQAQGFTSEDENVLLATYALNTGFGENTNPWQGN